MTADAQSSAQIVGYLRRWCSHPQPDQSSLHQTWGNNANVPTGAFLKQSYGLYFCVVVGWYYIISIWILLHLDSSKHLCFWMGKLVKHASLTGILFIIQQPCKTCVINWIVPHGNFCTTLSEMKQPVEPCFFNALHTKVELSCSGVCRVFQALYRKWVLTESILRL